MPAKRSFKATINAITLCGLSILTSVGHAGTLEARLDAIDLRLARLERAMEFGFDPEPEPDPQPAPAPVPVRADSFPAARAAIASGARWIQTTGLDIGTDLDGQGAVIELIPGGPSWKPAIALSGDAALSNVTIKTPPSTYNATGHRTGFYKAITATGRNMTLRNVTFAPDTGFCIHHFKGNLKMESVKATTFSEYFVFQESDTLVQAKWCEVKGGSRAESIWRVSAANYLIEDSLLDNSSGGKAALRGDSPSRNGEPGGIVRRTKFVGQVGANPLTEDDGGQMNGIDRWRYAEGWLYQLDSKRKPECIAFARQLYLAGKTAEEIVRATADKFINGEQLAKVAKGKKRLSDYDIKLTLELRKKDVTRQSTVLLEECEIVGDFRINARLNGTIRHTTIRSTGDQTPISGNSQQTYPFPVDRVIVGGEQQPAPQLVFDGVALTGGPSLGINPKAWPTLKFINGTTYDAKPIAQAPVERIFNSTPFQVEGFTSVHTDGGLTFRDAMGRFKCAWIGGYDGPGGTTARPAPWTTRWREYDPETLRAYARSLKMPMIIVDLETWEFDPNVHGEATARKWLERVGELCQAIKNERPDLIVGCYDLVPASNYWALANWAAWLRWKETGVRSNDLPDAWWAMKEAEYRAEYEKWQRKNDFTASIVLPHVDALFPSIYPSYRMPAKDGQEPNDAAVRGRLETDREVVRMRVEEAVRIAGGKPVYPFYWPVVVEDGGEVVDASRTINSVNAAFEAGANALVIWSDQRPRELIVNTLQTARSTVSAMELEK